MVYCPGGILTLVYCAGGGRCWRVNRCCNHRASNAYTRVLRAKSAPKCSALSSCMPEEGVGRQQMMLPTLQDS
jgi:hypothetical protein